MEICTQPQGGTYGDTMAPPGLSSIRSSAVPRYSVEHTTSSPRRAFLSQVGWRSRWRLEVPRPACDVELSLANNPALHGVGLEDGDGAGVHFIVYIGHTLEAYD